MAHTHHGDARKVLPRVGGFDSTLSLLREGYRFVPRRCEQLGADAQSKSKDIKVDGIDITIGGKRILSDTNLTLAFGRRYGLVGQNGIGKSTLLRALSKREVAIPTHISILHVEQEVSLSHHLL